MSPVLTALLFAFRKYAVDGLPASGVANPSKDDIETFGRLLETALADAAGNLIGFETVALRDADAGQADGQLAYVWNNNGEADDPANGIYQWDDGESEWVAADWYFQTIAAIAAPVAADLVTPEALAAIAAAAAAELIVIAAAGDTEEAAVNAVATARKAELLSWPSREMYASTADALSQGVTSVAVSAGGTGGTNNTYPWTTTGGGGTGASGYLTVAAGAIASVTVEHRGRGYTSAPTLVYTVPGLTGTVTLVVNRSQNETAGCYFVIPVADGFQAYVVDSGGTTATAVEDPRPTLDGVRTMLNARGGFFETTDPDTLALRRIGLSLAGHVVDFPQDPEVDALIAGAVLSSFFETTDPDTLALGRIALDGDGLRVPDTFVTAEAMTAALKAERPWLRGAANLRKTRETIRAIKHGVSAQLGIVLQGNSWLHGPAYGAQDLAVVDLLGLIGFAGGGWIGSGSYTGLAADINGHVAAFLYGVTRTGTWTDAYGTAVHSPDTCKATCTTGAGRYTYTAADNAALPPCTAVKHFYEGATGTIRHRWNGGAWEANTVLSASTGLQIVSLGNVPATRNWTLDVERVSGTWHNCGTLLETAATGAVLHKMAATGCKTQDLAGANATSMQAGLAAINPKLFILGDLSINDRGPSGGAVLRTPAQVMTDTGTHIDRARAACPAADFLLFNAPEIVGSYALPMSAYADAIGALVASKGVAVIDYQPLFGAAVADYNYASARALLGSDGVHPNIATTLRPGARLCGDTLFRALTCF